MTNSGGPVAGRQLWASGLPDSWPRPAGTLSARHGLEEMENPESCRPATFPWMYSKRDAHRHPARLNFEGCFAHGAHSISPSS
jgi:hypothetical protein